VTRIAYLANSFPASSEPYVISEINALRARGLEVLPCSVRDPGSSQNIRNLSKQDILYFKPARAVALLRSLVLALRRSHTLADIIGEAMREKNESLSRRLRTLVHTALGIYFAALVEDRAVSHIHVHHGYFSSWVAMVAARLLGISYSITFHGSDVLINRAFLKPKLRHCSFCTTISEFNRTVLISAHPDAADRIFIRRMGVGVPPSEIPSDRSNAKFSMFAAGRLHPVKGFDFLLQACRKLVDSGFDFGCRVAGEGNERRHLEELLDQLALRDHVALLGQQSGAHLESHYRAADLVVLTSKSEGIPLVLMEAMARGKIVLAPRITGIPELVIHGKTGFLYTPGDLADFVATIRMIERSLRSLQVIRRAARAQVLAHFEREKNVAAFCDLLTSQVDLQNWPGLYAHPVLQ
jgi:colanic acid/amylovoran biosynthesis glycosyltransferase